MRILNASHVADTGGNGIRTKWAFDKYAPEHHYRSTCTKRDYLMYPRDLPWSEALAEWRKADVVHVRDRFTAEALLGAPRRPTVIHHHGTQFRRHHVRLMREARSRRAIGLAATLDLWLMYPNYLTWMPALYDLAMLERMSRPLDDGILRIAHAPTNRETKSTAAFLAACEQLGKEVPVEVILVEQTSWTECIKRKAVADIYFDQTQLGYGNNAIEAWGMGQPVIAGGAPETLQEMERRFGSLPFVLADEGSILPALRSLVSPGARAEWAGRGREHVEAFHSEEGGVARLLEVYEAAADRRAVAA